MSDPKPAPAAPAAPSAPNEKVLIAKLVFGLILFVAALVRLGAALLPDASSAAYNRGVQAYEAREFPAAEKAFRTAAEKNPSLAPAWMNLGLTELELKNLPAAETAARKAVELLDGGQAEGLPKSRAEAMAMRAQAHANLAMVLMQAGRPADALPEIRRALELDPQNPKAETWKLAEQELGRRGPKPE